MRWLQPSSRAVAAVALLAVALGAAAPLAHAHLDAAQAAAAGLCGEHHAPEQGEPGKDCTLCLAGAHTAAAFDSRARALSSGPERPAACAAAASDPASAAPRAPGNPRAPPQRA